MPFIIVNSPKDDIWEVNPALELISEFKEFKKKEGDKRSSDILKAIYYVYDPKSELRDSGLEESKLLEDVTEGMIGDPDFDWDEYQYVKDLYMKYNISKNEKLVLGFQAEIESMQKFMADWQWTKKDAKMKADTMTTFRKLFDDLEEVQQAFSQEKQEYIEMQAGYSLSRFESYGTDK